MELLDFPETSVSYYHPPLGYIPGERRNPPHCGGSLETKTDLLHFLWDQMCAFRRFCKIAKIDNSFVMSVCSSIRLCFRMEQLGSHWADFHEVRYLRFFQKSVENTKIPLTSDKNWGTLQEDQYIILITWRSVLIGMRSVSDINCTENQNTHFISMFHRAFFNSIIDKHQHMHFTFNNILV